MHLAHARWCVQMMTQANRLSPIDSHRTSPPGSRAKPSAPVVPSAGTTGVVTQPLPAGSAARPEPPSAPEPPP